MLIRERMREFHAALVLTLTSMRDSHICSLNQMLDTADQLLEEACKHIPEMCFSFSTL